MRRRKSPADQFWSTHRDHLPTNLYNNVAFLKYVWQDPLTSWFICKVVPAGGGGEGRGGEGRGVRRRHCKTTCSSHMCIDCNHVFLHVHISDYCKQLNHIHTSSGIT